MPQILKQTDVTRQQLDLFVSFISSFLLYHWDRSWPIHLIHFFFLSPASLRSWALKAAVCKRPWRWHLAGKADRETPWYSPISWPQTFCQRLHPVLSTCYSGPVAGHCWAAPLSCQTSQNSYALCNQMTLPEGPVLILRGLGPGWYLQLRLISSQTSQQDWEVEIMFLCCFSKLQARHDPSCHTDTSKHPHILPTIHCPGEHALWTKMYITPDVQICPLFL